MANKRIKQGYRKQVGPACVVVECNGVLEIEDSAHGSKQRLTAEGADALAAAVAEAVEAADVKDNRSAIDEVELALTQRMHLGSTVAELCAVLDDALAEKRERRRMEREAGERLSQEAYRVRGIDAVIDAVRRELRFKLTGE
jgi:hypothetical protein